jgi:prophage regulatory protein
MPQRVLRRKAVETKTGHSTSTIYEKMAAGEFPRPVKLGVRAVGWLEDEIDAYIDQRIADRHLEEVRRSRNLRSST